MAKMTMRKLASAIAKREGKKHQASVGDVREILKIIYTLDAEDKMSRATETTVPAFGGPIIALMDESNEAWDKLYRAKLKKLKPRKKK